MSTVEPLKTLVRETAKEAKTQKEKGLADFIRLLFADAIPDDIAGFSPVDLAELARGRLNHLTERRPGRPKIAITEPEGAFASVTVIDIVNDDMPFLVDSTLGLLNERGHEIKLFLHPVIAVKRDASGKLQSVHEKQAAMPGLARESFIHVQIARIDEPSAATLEKQFLDVFAEVRAAVLDWRAMTQAVKQAITAYRSEPPPIPIEEVTETIAFIEWLLDNHFTFLGVRDYTLELAGSDKVLKPLEGSGMGILRNSSAEILQRGGDTVSMTPEILNFLNQPAPLIITKADIRSQVHRRVAMDYIGIKRFDETGDVKGELRIAGLFTSSAYTQNPAEIPVLRKKLSRIVASSGFDPGSHSGKALISVLENFPRDELFQIEPDELDRIAHGILRLEERPQTKLFARRDRFDRFVSAFVFIPRDRFNSAVRLKIGALLAEAFDGEVASFSPFFGENNLVRVHFNIARRAGHSPKPDMIKLEQTIAEAVRTWDDRLEESLRSDGAGRLISRWSGAFPAGYRDETEPELALKDVHELETLRNADDVAVEFRKAGIGNACHLRVYRCGTAIPLSERLPILENMGFRSVSETTYDIAPRTAEGTGKAVIHDILLEPRVPNLDPLSTRFPALEESFMAVWKGQADSDGFNALTLAVNMNWREIALLRAAARYLKQASATYSVEYMAQTLVKHSAVAVKLVELFRAKFAPQQPDPQAGEKAAEAIEAALAQIPSLDEDLIIRRYLNLLSAMTRTNFFQAVDGSAPLAITFKLESKSIDSLPEPKPFAEIYVFSPDVEGVHLRMGPIARGGLRWSDRPEDFRTEVLGLVKAQNVKNAVIVPVGAKGGFVPKKLPLGGTRDEIQAEGIRAYKIFVSGLLELTDNLVDGKIAPPPRITRRDGDDPYLVVAADKGTATFSDIANGLSVEHSFWLGDAFASGGSAGYDHKKMAITARGAWEAVKRHFLEMNVDIQSTPFTVIGVGDMSGDVFGNGMLLSRKIRLLAAFDHRDIFIDPNPDPENSFNERQRLFNLPRSSWQDYNKALISEGGGLFSRQLKAIPLSPQIKSLTGLTGNTTTPQTLMNAILKAEADLLWFGGIGTYVKALNESNADAGDRANDSIRVDASELKVKVVGEGANLGVTQRARVEFALRGGRINTDAVDNSAGVNSSDMEVNIKIALGPAETSGKLTRPERNALLAEMTDEVAERVLRNNYLQTLCLSLAHAAGTEETGFEILLMQSLEERGLLDRKLEFLPADAVVIERDAKGGGLTRPELAVLMAYAKLALNADLLASSVPDDEYLGRDLLRYFPGRMREQFEPEIQAHRLRREIIATMLSNSMINRGGPSFVTRLLTETGAQAAGIAAAFAVARDSFGFIELNGLVDALDAKIDGPLQMDLYLDLHKQLRWATTWFVRNEQLGSGLASLVDRYKQGIDEVRGLLSDVLPEQDTFALKERIDVLVAAGVPLQTAEQLAAGRLLIRAMDIVRIAGKTGAAHRLVAAVVYGSASILGIERLAREAGKLFAKDLVERRAINRLISQLFQTHRAIASRIVEEAKEQSLDWPAWLKQDGAALNRTAQAIEPLLAEKSFDLARLAVAQGMLADLSNV